MRVIIDGWAWLERGALSEGNLRALRTALTVQPILTTDVAGVAQPKSIMLYRDRPEEGLFGVPRGFYRASAEGQNEEVVRVSRGSAMQPMTSCYRADGPFAQQAEALAVLQHQLMSNSWGGGILCAGCGSGKALAHGEPVLLRRGWTSIEEVRVGDEAAGTDGGFHRVTGVFPQGERDLFRVAFSDGTHVDCDGDHLWTLVKRRKRDAPTVTISTHDLARETLRTSVGRLLWLPTMAPLEGVDGWQRKVGRAVESVTAIGKGLATCISVDAPNHLYLTRNCVPTHNTILAVELARRLGRATLVVVHKEFFLEQWAARIRDVLPAARIGVVRQDTCDYRDKDFVIAMIQSLAKDVQTQRYPRALYEAFGMFVSDECFPAEQKIDTPDGKVAIGDVVIGMTVFNALGEGVVEHVFKRSVCVSDCVVVSLLCGVDIVCTKNHPFLTVDGWKHASSLCGDVLVSFDDCTRMRMEHGEGSQEHTGNMCVLREGEQRQEGTEVLLDDMFGTGDTTEDYEWSSFLRFLRREQTDGEAKKVLFGVLSAESTQSLHAGSFDGVFLYDARKTCEGFFAEGKRFAPYARQEPYAHAWRDRKGYGDQTEEWVCAVKKTRGEWMRHACSTACVARSAGRWMDRGVRCSDITAEEQSIQVAELLQDRRRTSDDEASDRGGWVFSFSKDEGPRCEEGSFFEGERVVGVAVAQREDFERLGFRTDGDCVDVFNLSVSGHPSYVLDGGIVVHNCHHIGSEVWSSVAHRFTAAYRLGLSATPRRADRAEPVFFHHIGPILHTMQAQSMPFGVRLLQSDSELTGIRRGDYRVSAMRMNSAQVISQLGEDAARTRHIAEDIAIAVRKGRKVMVVSHRLEHLRAFRADLRKILEVAPPPFPVAIAPYTGQWFTGEEGEAKRTLTREELREAERANVLLCTIQLVAEGLDVSALDVIVLATPLGDAEQAIGRVRRWCTPAPEKCAHYCPWRAGQCTGKPTPVVVDVRDPEVAWSERKARGRDKLYRRMGVALPGEEEQGRLAVDKPPVVG